jgi:uncharacterized membrane protein YphA (DoxX/SURF4 family)
MITDQKKYWCPTHPEVESDDPNAICTKCGTMKLIPRKPDTQKMPGHTFADFLPLIGMLGIVIILTALLSFLQAPSSWMVVMRLFMGSFFLVFGVLKLIKLPAFAAAYKDYDVIAMRSNAYAHVYPFIELGLGILFIANLIPLFTNWFTFIIMSIGALGVYLKLRKKEEIPCACLGMVFKVPMTWVTFIEDIVMAGMALVMIIIS